MLTNNIFKKRMPDILECIANLSSDEVFTPPPLANKILDLLPNEVWSNPELKFIDPACKTGIFLRECAKRLMGGLEKVIPDEDKRREHIFKNMLYGIAITDITALMSRRSLYYSKSGISENAVIKFENATGNVIYKNLEHTFEKRKCIHCGAAEDLLDVKVEGLENHAYQFIHQDINNLFKDMKFSVIIGNPPYQLNDGGFGASAMPIYHKFIETAMNLNPRYISMIIPSRWFAGGKGLDDFRAKMLSDKRLKVLVDHPNAEDCFPGVEIKGGVCYFLWDSKYNGECEVVSMLAGEEVSRAKRSLDEHATFIRFNESIDIIKKIRAKNEVTFDKKVSSMKPFGFRTFFNDFKQNEFKNSVKIFVNPTLGKVGWVDKKKIEVNKGWVDKYKVLLAMAAEGKGTFPNNILGKPILAEKNSCCTETYLVVDVFDDKDKAENLVKYIRTRFFRYLISLKKNDHHLSKDKFSFVPDLDMSKEWTDEKLFKRYEITEKEQAFIKSIVKEMI
jgi:site-specific DNA-methyltransferase (adenine-specific)